MHATDSLHNACALLDHAISSRLRDYPLTAEVEKIRFPTGLFFIRGDREGVGKDLAKQASASFDYWNRDSGQYLDVVFPGWGMDGSTMCWTGLDGFMWIKSEVEAVSKWRFSGESEILLLNYDFKLTVWNGPRSFIGKGEFAFDEVILLPVEGMLYSSQIRSLDAFMQELINSAKKSSSRSDKSTLWEIRDRVAFDRSRRAGWEGIKKMFLKDFSQIYDELRPFVVCDLRI